MKNKLVLCMTVAAVLVVVCGPVLAHHGSQGYDFSRGRITVKGTVVRYTWENPHSQIYLEAKDDSGKTTTWAMELNNPGNLVPLGWTHSSLKVGDDVTLTFYPGKEGKPVGICVDVLTADGRKFHATQGCGLGTNPPDQNNAGGLGGR